MSNKVIGAVVIILLIPLMGTLFLSQTEKCCRDIMECINAAESSHDDKAILKAIDILKNNEKKLTALTTHDEVDAIFNALHRALALRRLNDIEECRQALSEAYTSAVIVKNFDRPSLRNIF